MSVNRPLPLALAAALLATAVLAGCAAPTEKEGPPGGSSYKALGFNGTHWPDLHGAKVRILAYGSFESSFGEHKKRFENLTNGTLELLVEPDSGKVIERATRERGAPSYDVIYGIDNVLYAKAKATGIFAPYRPQLVDRLNPSYVFDTTYAATPVSHGYIAVNVDPRAGLNVTTLDEVKDHAEQFVTEDPRTSTPGLGFLIATVAAYGEKSDARYDYIDYWNDLFAGGALVVADWSAAYANHFSGGYGQSEGKADRAIVTSYTTSPAYEMYYGYETENGVVTAPNSTFHQIQVLGIAAGTKNRVAAEAFLEYALSNGFQELLAEAEAIYPVVRGVDVTPVYQGRDPAPDTLEPAPFPYEALGANVERWVKEWRDAYEAHQAR